MVAPRKSAPRPAPKPTPQPAPKPPKPKPTPPKPTPKKEDKPKVGTPSKTLQLRPTLDGDILRPNIRQVGPAASARMGASSTPLPSPKQGTNPRGALVSKKGTGSPLPSPQQKKPAEQAKKGGAKLPSPKQLKPAMQAKKGGTKLPSPKTR